MIVVIQIAHTIIRQAAFFTLFSENLTFLVISIEITSPKIEKTNRNAHPINTVRNLEALACLFQRYTNKQAFVMKKNAKIISRALTFVFFNSSNKSLRVIFISFPPCLSMYYSCKNAYSDYTII